MESFNNTILSHFFAFILTVINVVTFTGSRLKRRNDKVEIVYNKLCRITNLYDEKVFLYGRNETLSINKTSEIRKLVEQVEIIIYDTWFSPYKAVIIKILESEPSHPYTKLDELENLLKKLEKKLYPGYKRFKDNNNDFPDFNAHAPGKLFP